MIGLTKPPQAYLAHQQPMNKPMHHQVGTKAAALQVSWLVFQGSHLYHQMPQHHFHGMLGQQVCPQKHRMLTLMCAALNLE